MTSLVTHLFSRGPAICVHVIEDSLGWKTHLVDSPVFSLATFAKISPILRQTMIHWMEQYSLKSCPPVDFLPRQNLPPFTQTVTQALSNLPFGAVMSYSELAALCGSKRASRAVGNVCHKNRFPFFIPCHRIIHQTGKIGGFALPLSIKEKLLSFESVTYLDASS